MYRKHVYSPLPPPTPKPSPSLRPCLRAVTTPLGPRVSDALPQTLTVQRARLPSPN